MSRFSFYMAFGLFSADEALPVLHQVEKAGRKCFLEIPDSIMWSPGNPVIYVYIYTYIHIYLYMFILYKVL